MKTKKNAKKPEFFTTGPQTLPPPIPNLQNKCFFGKIERQTFFLKKSGRSEGFRPLNGLKKEKVHVFRGCFGTDLEKSSENAKVSELPTLWYAGV